MRVLVTGSEGRIGRYLAGVLDGKGYSLRGFDTLADTQAAGGPIDDRHVGDLRNLAAVRSAMRGVDAVVHLGAIPSDRDDGAAVMQTNVMGSWNVLQAAQENGVRRVVRAQQACGGASFNNLLGPEAAPIDFAAHARSLGAQAEQVKTIADLEGALERARRADRTSVVVIETDPGRPFTGGGAWWDVPVPEVSTRPEVKAARQAYDTARRRQRSGS